MVAQWQPGTWNWRGCEEHWHYNAVSHHKNSTLFLSLIKHVHFRHVKFALDISICLNREMLLYIHVLKKYGFTLDMLSCHVYPWTKVFKVIALELLKLMIFKLLSLHSQLFDWLITSGYLLFISLDKKFILVCMWNMNYVCPVFISIHSGSWYEYIRLTKCWYSDTICLSLIIRWILHEKHFSSWHKIQLNVTFHLRFHLDRILF